MKQKHEQCERCGQTLTYELTLGKGSFLTLKTLSKFIGYKGINMVHPTKELLGNGLTNYQIGNLSILRFHGLIAKIKDNPGNYGLTRKGMALLNGEYPVKETVIVLKAHYDKPAKTLSYCGKEMLAGDFQSDWCEYWRSNSFEIRSGRVIHEKEIPVKREEKREEPKLI